jgi:2-dehydropantoate 2-reductase
MGAMRISVMGAGGVGGVFGGLLARAGNDVSFLARGDHLAAIRDHGLTVHGPWGTFVVHPGAAASSGELAGKVPFDAVLVAVKTWQVRELAPALRPLVGGGTVVVPLQNGVEAAPILAGALGEGRVAGGFCQVFAWREGAGEVRTTGTPLQITLGEMGGGGSARLERLAEAIRTSGAAAAVVDDVLAATWEKFLFIDPFGSVGAAARAPLGAMRTEPRTRELLLAAAEEVAAVGRARGVRLAPDAVARTMARYDELPAAATASMQRDVAAGRPSELHEQTGAVVRLGEEAGIPVPAHRFLLAALLPQERAARGQKPG